MECLTCWRYFLEAGLEVGRATLHGVFDFLTRSEYKATNFKNESIPGEASVLPFSELRTLLCLCANTDQASYTIPVFNKHERQSVSSILFHIPSGVHKTIDN